jgi:hypothetical protein
LRRQSDRQLNKKIKTKISPVALVSTKVKEQGGRSTALRCRPQGNTQGATKSGRSMSGYLRVREIMRMSEVK